MDITLDTNLPWLKERLIFLTKHGSHAYGTSTPESDEDFRGIAIPPLPYFFGYLERFEQAKFETPDLTIFDIRKFIKLAADANPNVLELLYTDPSDHIVVHPFAQALIEHRDLFLSQRCLHSFTSFAASQLRRLQRHKERTTDNRCEKRKDLERRYGYDTKDGMHVIRLMRMCKEVLMGQGVIVRRPDAEELLAIKHGAWPLEHLLAYAQRMEAELQKLRETTKLPRVPDHHRLDAICTEIVEASFNHEILVPIMMTGFQHQTWSFARGSLVEKKLLDESGEEPS